MTQHFVHLGRSRQNGWLLLDDQKNVSGRSKGGLVGLNLHSGFYVGGLDFVIKEELPTGMDFVKSFSGELIYKIITQKISNGKTCFSFRLGNNIMT